MSSAAEAELGAMVLNAKEAVPICCTFQELGHPQPLTPIVTDNTTVHGIACNVVKQKHSKAMDMRFYWIQDCIQQKQFASLWAPSEENHGDFHTKAHSQTLYKNLSLLLSICSKGVLIWGKTPDHMQARPHVTSSACLFCPATRTACTFHQAT